MQGRRFCFSQVWKGMGFLCAWIQGGWNTAWREQTWEVLEGFLTQGVSQTQADSFFLEGKAFQEQDSASRSEKSFEDQHLLHLLAWREIGKGGKATLSAIQWLQLSRASQGLSFSSQMRSFLKFREVREQFRQGFYQEARKGAEILEQQAGKSVSERAEAVYLQALIDLAERNPRTAWHRLNLFLTPFQKKEVSPSLASHSTPSLAFAEGVRLQFLEMRAAAEWARQAPTDWEQQGGARFVESFTEASQEGRFFLEEGFAQGFQKASGGAWKVLAGQWRKVVEQKGQISVPSAWLVLAEKQAPCGGLEFFEFLQEREGGKSSQSSFKGFELRCWKACLQEADVLQACALFLRVFPPGGTEEVMGLKTCQIALEKGWKPSREEWKGFLSRVLQQGSFHLEGSEAFGQTFLFWSLYWDTLEGGWSTSLLWRQVFPRHPAWKRVFLKTSWKAWKEGRLQQETLQQVLEGQQLVQLEQEPLSMEEKREWVGALLHWPDHPILGELKRFSSFKKEAERVKRRGGRVSLKGERLLPFWITQFKQWKRLQIRFPASSWRVSSLQKAVEKIFQEVLQECQKGLQQAEQELRVLPLWKLHQGDWEKWVQQWSIEEIEDKREGI